MIGLDSIATPGDGVGHGVGYWSHDDGDGRGSPSSEGMRGCKFTNGTGHDGYGVGWDVGDENALDCGCEDPGYPDFIRSAHDDLRRTVVDTVAFRHIFQVV